MRLLFTLSVFLVLVALSACQNATYPTPTTPTSTNTAPTLAATETPTEIPTSQLPDQYPRLIFPPDGAVLDTAIPAFKYEIIPNAQGYEVYIGSKSGFAALWVTCSIECSDVYFDYPNYATPGPLPDGEYSWIVCAARYSTPQHRCSKETFTFTIVRANSATNTASTGKSPTP